ncbi:MAG: DUF898 family protein [Bradyrhizobium sp.]|uniref:DUF898 family protein n=1 Tax=Bradyrhizobium sp. TaxID=376 RepID=UPI001D3C1CAC|nr:DUF898 family protein [Bradyrhizobium sp.]MBV9562565.1 DUF898 family protein [Bradyrhizobium sp.]
MSFVAGQPPGVPPAPVAFSGNRGRFLSLASRGAALELVTFGFYRFWLVTDIRRHLWSHTLVDGDAPEYTGRGRELLVGFLFAMAILVPIYLVYFVIGIEAERFKAFASVPLVIGFYAFGQFAIYRARRYRLTRTVWRGVRFWMDGSGWAYAWRSMLWGLLVLVTLGGAYAWREAALERYKMHHSHYGDLQGSFEGRGWELFKRTWGLWLFGPVAWIIFPLLPIFYAEFKAREWRWWLCGIRFGDVRLESKLPNTALYGLYWKVIGWFLLFDLVIGAYVALCVFLLKGSGPMEAAMQALPKNIPFMVLLVIGYLAFILAFNVVMRLYFQRDLWARVASSTKVHAIESAENVTAKGEAASALGEGFADGLDVAGF